MQAIGAMGGDIRPYIPHRLREGYGLNTEAIEQLAAEGVRAADHGRLRHQQCARGRPRPGSAALT